MTIGALITGFLGDRYGRRFTYQFNLMIFGLASLAAAFAPGHGPLIAAVRDGSGPRRRDRGRLFDHDRIRAAGLARPLAGLHGVPRRRRAFPATTLLGYLIIPNCGWRPMFVIAGVGSLIVWYLRKALPESPRWLEAQGRTAEAEALMQAIEAEAASRRPLPPPAPAGRRRRSAFASLFSPALLPRMVVGSVVLITINTLIFGFVTGCRNSSCSRV